jgi:hypothetical protein
MNLMFNLIFIVMYEKTELNQNVTCNMQNAMHHPATTNFIINTLNTSQQ